jgi:GT2 family glycosyltransferase
MAMPAVTIDVVVPVYGGRELTERCLEALAGQTRPHRVIVVDNASPDDTVAALRERHPQAALIELSANKGYAAACNAGIAGGDGEVVVLMNNDVIARPDFLERLTAPLEADPALGSATPVLLRPGEREIDNVGLAADSTLAGFPRLQGLPADRAASARPVLLGPSGAAAAYRRVALAGVGGLDEAIFLYQEDLDLALRVRAAGWPTALAENACAVHLGSATAGRRSAWQRRHAGFARGYLLRKHGVLRSEGRLRALATELLVIGGDMALSRDLAALRGRLAGWRAGARASGAAPPREGVDAEIGLREGLRLRRSDYAVAGPASPGTAAPPSRRRE